MNERRTTTILGISVFFAIWITVGLVVCLSESPLSLPILVFVGIASYLIGWGLFKAQPNFSLKWFNIRAIIIHIAALTSIALASVAFLIVCGAAAYLTPVHFDAIGDASGHSSTCQLSRLYSATSSAGTEAIVRDANCPGKLAQGTSYYLVVIHARAIANSKDNLAFQYTPGFIENVEAPPPRIAWNGASRLTITATGPFERITVLRTKISGVRVDYTLRTDN